MTVVPGHQGEVKPTKSGRRFYCTCSCGYTSTTRISQREATLTLIHHLGTVEALVRANGLTP